MNTIALTGNICKDVQVKYTRNNKSYVENTIGVQKEKKDDEGNYESDFIDFVVFEKKADYLGNYAKKGDKIELTGKLRVDTWESEQGERKQRTYVVADTVKILTSRPKQSKNEETPF